MDRVVIILLDDDTCEYLTYFPVELNFYCWGIANYRYNKFLFAGHRVKEDLWRNMVSENFSASFPRGHVIGVVTHVMHEGNVV